MRILRDPAPVEGGNNPPPPTEPAGNTGAPPPAAEVVVTGERTERELALEKDLESERKARKAVEIEHATLADENFQLKKAGIKPAPKDDRSVLERWYAGEEID